jgi:hypothetical protein
MGKRRPTSERRSTLATHLTRRPLGARLAKRKPEMMAAPATRIHSAVLSRVQERCSWEFDTSSSFRSEAIRSDMRTFVTKLFSPGAIPPKVAGVN